MKKLILLCAPIFSLLPVIGMTATCVPYSNVIYSLQANGANGTLTKSQTCTGDSNNGSYAINSQINVKKGFFSKQINQAATGTYASPNTITAQSFINSNNNAPLPPSNLDTLSLVLYLSSSLSANMTTFLALPIFYNGNTITVQCAMSTGSSTAVPATQITCPTADNATVLSYSFSQDASPQMLTAPAVENGTTTMSAAINQ